MPSSSRVREIPILRGTDQRQSHQTSHRTSSPVNSPLFREIPIQRDTGVGGRPFSDFLERQDHTWGDPWPNHRGSRNADVFDNEPQSRASGLRSRAGFPSHVGNDFWRDRRSPVQKPFFRHSDDYSARHGEERSSSPYHAESPVVTSQPPQQPVPSQQPVTAETTTPIPPPEEPKQNVPVVIEPTVSDAAPMPHETEANNNATDASLHVEEPPRRPRSPSPAPPNMTSLEIIEQVLAEGFRLKEEVEAYTGGRKEKQYLRLEELLTRLMLKLDRIESEGRDDIRSARREAVHTIESILGLLESRTSAAAANKALPSTESSASPGNSPSDDPVSETNTETSSANDNSRDSEQTKNNADAAAVKEMVLRSEVPC